MAAGAEKFYSLENNTARTEGLELARELDAKAAQSWLGHPCYDVIDNSTDFEAKCRRCLAVTQLDAVRYEEKIYFGVFMM